MGLESYTGEKGRRKNREERRSAYTDRVIEKMFRFMGASKGTRNALRNRVFNNKTFDCEVFNDIVPSVKIATYRPHKARTLEAEVHQFLSVGGFLKSELVNTLLDLHDAWSDASHMVFCRFTSANKDFVLSDFRGFELDDKEVAVVRKHENKNIVLQPMDMFFRWYRTEARWSIDDFI